MAMRVLSQNHRAIPCAGTVPGPSLPMGYMLGIRRETQLILDLIPIHATPRPPAIAVILLNKPALELAFVSLTVLLWPEAAPWKVKTRLGLFFRLLPRCNTHCCSSKPCLGGTLR